MNVSELIAEVNDQRRDTTSNFVDDGEILRYFNQCLRKLEREHDWDFNRTSASFTYTAGSPRYAVSSIGDGYWKNPIDLFAGYQYHFEFVDANDFMYLSSMSTNVWAFRGDAIFVNNETNVTQLSVTYYTSCMAKTSGGSWQTALSATTDSPIMPERFHDVLTDYALMKIYRKEGLLDDYQISKTDYERKIQDLKNEYIARTAKPLRSWGHINDRSGSTLLWDKKENPLRQ